MFYGVALSGDARRAAAQYAQAARLLWPGRYVEEGNLHMTLCYVGEVEPSRLDQLRRIGALAAAALPHLPLALGGPGYFGKPDRAILYLHALGGANYAAAAQALRRLLQAADMPYDPKPFVPHITLARSVRLGEGVPAPVRQVAWSPAGLTLFLSHRVEGALSYTPLALWP